MINEHFQYLQEHQERLALIMLRYCRNLARFRYRWSDGTAMPEGKDPGVLVEEVLKAYADGKRKFSPLYSIEAQLKGGVKSRLWALYQKKSSHNDSLEQLEESGTCVRCEDIAPDAAAANSHDTEVLFSILRNTPEVRRSKGLQNLITAIEAGSDDVRSQVDATGLSEARIYELRRQLKAFIPRVMVEFNKEGKMLI